jgi:hypothetical protein
VIPVAVPRETSTRIGDVWGKGRGSAITSPCTGHVSCLNAKVVAYMEQRRIAECRWLAEDLRRQGGSNE